MVKITFMKYGRRFKKKLLKTLVVERVNDGVGDRRSLATGSKTVKKLEAVCQPCNVALVDIFKSRADEYLEPVGSCCQK